VAAGAVATAATLALVNGGTSAAVAGESPFATSSPGLSTVDPAQDGRDLFRGVFFLTGPQGPLVVEAAQIPDDLVERNQTAEAAAQVNTVVAAVDEIDPAFFASFAGQMRSGDPFAVEQAIADGHGMIMQASEHLDASAEPDGSPDPGTNTVWAAAAVLIVVAVVASVAVGANVVVLGEAVWVGSPGVDGLGREQMVAALTEAFAA
jgi:SdpC family antimicrobial peptide